MIPKLIIPLRHGDSRGWFCESYSARRLAEAGIDELFVQDNHSFSPARGMLRGIQPTARLHSLRFA